MNETAVDMSYPRQVQASFASSEQMQDAVSRLSVSGFDRAEISLPTGEPDGVEAGPASTEDDARQARTLGASTVGAAAAMAAAGITIATGGAAAPAVAAAVLAGGAAGGATFAAQGAGNAAEQQTRDDLAASGDLVLTVRPKSEAKQLEAEAILKAAGATDIQTVS